jgi:hypothetical protein
MVQSPTDTTCGGCLVSVSVNYHHNQVVAHRVDERLSGLEVGVVACCLPGPRTPGPPRTDPLEVRVVYLGAGNDALRLECQFGYDGAGQYVGDGDVAQFSDECVECQSVDRSETG